MLALMDIKATTQQELTPAHIAVLVDRFYARVRRHPELGPVFEAAVADWDLHLERLRGFWCWVALRDGGYRGNPMAVHQRLPLTAAHFHAWLELWRVTANEVLDEAPATRMIAYAERIAHGLRLGTIDATPAANPGPGPTLAHPHR